VSRVALFSFLAAFVLFCVVQDRVTARGADRYVTQQRAALAAGRPGPALDQVMGPVIRRSVEQGLLWGGAVALVGVAAAAAGRRRRRE
jgi:MYXO-CTERM domain-containing protein